MQHCGTGKPSRSCRAYFASANEACSSVVNGFALRLDDSPSLPSYLGKVSADARTAAARIGKLHPPTRFRSSRHAAVSTLIFEAGLIDEAASVLRHGVKSTRVARFNKRWASFARRAKTRDAALRSSGYHACA